MSHTLKPSISQGVMSHLMSDLLSLRYSNCAVYHDHERLKSETSVCSSETTVIWVKHRNCSAFHISSDCPMFSIVSLCHCLCHRRFDVSDVHLITERGWGRVFFTSVVKCCPGFLPSSVFRLSTE